ncbi:MAG: hypothetical protein Q8R04_02035 [Nanoarchaeota archaeon]|nr:hypothetical protein [Nanoarchaeota archaeon]
MRGLVIFLIVLVGIASFSFVAASISNVNEDEKEAKIAKFSTFTSAVCEKRADSVYCRDEFFVNCNGKISKAVDVAECNGVKLEAPKALGFAVFSKDWKDPRN